MLRFPLQRFGRSIVSKRSFSAVIVGDDDGFADLEKALADQKRIFYFTASWCPPCRMIGPEYEKLAKADVESGVHYLKLDIDDLPETAAQYMIRSVPTFIFMNGKERSSPDLLGADLVKMQSNVAKLIAS
jgi:thioredoxin 1